MTTENTRTPTAARTKPEGGGHWYDLDGTPRYEVQKADKSGLRSTTLADARKNNWVPSVTTILKVLHKEQLVRWMIEQAVLAVLTAPRKEGEPQDAFVKRVLQEEQQQDQEASIARDKGKEIHSALESYFSGEPVPPEMEVYARPVIDKMLEFGQRVSSEVILVGDDYAGMTDIIQDCPEWWRIWDFKSTKKLPEPNKGGAWSEHRLQLSAYAKAFQNKLKRAGEKLKPILVGNIYISTVNPGEFVICEHEDWEGTYEHGFAPIVRYWQWINRYRPANPKRVAEVVPVQASVSREDGDKLAEQLAATAKENGRLKSQVDDLRALLAKRQEQESEATPEPEPAPAPATQVQTAPAVTTAAAPVSPPPAKELPSVIRGKKVAWSTGMPVSSTSQPPPSTTP